jgi:hypothetical protein
MFHPFKSCNTENRVQNIKLNVCLSYLQGGVEAPIASIRSTFTPLLIKILVRRIREPLILHRDLYF